MKTALLLLGLSALIISFLADRQKTKSALKKTGIRLLKILPPLFATLLISSAALSLLPLEKCTPYLRNINLGSQIMTAGATGSILLLPGFIAYPIGGVLKDLGIPFSVIAGFTNALMLIGISTLPLESRYLGIKVTMARNIIAALAVGLIAVLTGTIYGEIIL